MSSPYEFELAILQLRDQMREIVRRFPDRAPGNIMATAFLVVRERQQPGAVHRTTISSGSQARSNPVTVPTYPTNSALSSNLSSLLPVSSVAVDIFGQPPSSSAINPHSILPAPLQEARAASTPVNIRGLTPRPQPEHLPGPPTTPRDRPLGSSLSKPPSGTPVSRGHTNTPALHGLLGSIPRPPQATQSTLPETPRSQATKNIPPNSSVAQEQTGSTARGRPFGFGSPALPAAPSLADNPTSPRPLLPSQTAATANARGSDRLPTFTFSRTSAQNAQANDTPKRTPAPDPVPTPESPPPSKIGKGKSKSTSTTMISGQPALLSEEELERKRHAIYKVRAFEALEIAEVPTEWVDPE